MRRKRNTKREREADNEWGVSLAVIVVSIVDTLISILIPNLWNLNPLNRILCSYIVFALSGFPRYQEG